MTRTLGPRCALWMSAWCVLALYSAGSTAQAAPPERPNLNHTADPRPNILPNWVYNHHVPYRLQYNRPAYHSGKALFYWLSPTSLEALSWKENLDAGRYNGHHCPPMYKGYYYLKPWEALNIGPRPDSQTASTIVPAPATSLYLETPELIPSSNNVVPLPQVQ